MSQTSESATKRESVTPALTMVSTTDRAGWYEYKGESVTPAPTMTPATTPATTAVPSAFSRVRDSMARWSTSSATPMFSLATDATDSFGENCELTRLQRESQQVPRRRSTRKDEKAKWKKDIKMCLTNDRGAALAARKKATKSSKWNTLTAEQQEQTMQMAALQKMEERKADNAHVSCRYAAFRDYATPHGPPEKVGRRGGDPTAKALLDQQLEIMEEQVRWVEDHDEEEDLPAVKGEDREASGTVDGSLKTNEAQDESDEKAEEEKHVAEDIGHFLQQKAATKTTLREESSEASEGESEDGDEDHAITAPIFVATRRGASLVASSPKHSAVRTSRSQSSNCSASSTTTVFGRSTQAPDEKPVLRWHWLEKRGWVPAVKDEGAISRNDKASVKRSRSASVAGEESKRFKVSG